MFQPPPHACSQAKPDHSSTAQGARKGSSQRSNALQFSVHISLAAKRQRLNGDAPDMLLLAICSIVWDVHAGQQPQLHVNASLVIAD
eukprot:9547524-Alexandrium_andersonii.AAC.1